MDERSQPSSEQAEPEPRSSSGDDQPPPAGVRIAFTCPDSNLTDRLASHTSALASVIEAITAPTDHPWSGEVRVRIVNDDEMARAHETYKSVPGTTDVLTFDLAETPGVLDVDLLVCSDEAHRQANDRAIPVEHELMLYITHGILHCIGYDDDTEHNAQAMHQREDEILRQIGIGAVFAAPAEHDR